MSVRVWAHPNPLTQMNSGLSEKAELHLHMTGNGSEVNECAPSLAVHTPRCPTRECVIYCQGQQYIISDFWVICSSPFMYCISKL